MNRMPMAARLAALLVLVAAVAAPLTIAVLNQGLGGNRVLQTAWAPTSWPGWTATSWPPPAPGG
jgi:hypothetical protein